VHLVEFFDRGVQLNPHGTAFVLPDGSGAVTYVDVEALSHRVAAALEQGGVAPGSPVGVLSGNTTTVFAWVLGILRAGCAWVALNARAAPDELADLLDLVGATTLLHAPELRETAAKVGAAAALDRVVEMAEGETGGWLAPPGARVPLPALDGEAMAAFVGTGGTTGRSKAVRVPHRAFETMILAFLAHLPEEDPVNLVAAPMTHAAGATVFPVLAVGGTNVVHDGVVPAEMLASIERNRVTRLFLPPTAVYALLADPDVRARDTSSLRYFLYGAAPMSVEKLQQALDVFGPVMAQCYGQAEVPMLCTLLSPQEHGAAVADPGLRHRLASCGRPTVVANVAIMDGDGNLVPRGERGEIVVRSSLLMDGYHDRPTQTAEARRPGGWHGTGDVGYVDEDGYVYIVDRTRDLIISGGFNVFPGEVEQVIWGHPAVNDCAVIGVPDEKWGERVTAVVEVKPGAEVGEAELIALCKERLGSVKAPKAVVFRGLPRSPVGKVLKRQLRDEHWAGRDRKV
jgi:acyl-CoA synthetase (AMP-forming)/AMP-acid ligase II